MDSNKLLVGVGDTNQLYVYTALAWGPVVVNKYTRYSVRLKDF